jgi:hypothetical protein
MTYSIEGVPATQTELVRAVQSLAASAKGIESSLDEIHGRLSHIGDCLGQLPDSANTYDRDKNLCDIVEQLMSIDRNFQAFCEWQSENS